MVTKEIKTENNHSVFANIYEAEKSNLVLVIASATGVKQSFYKKFAEFFSNKGITVITFDYQGIGLSLKKPIKKLENNASDWGEIDLEAVLEHSKNNYPDAKIVLLGHSIGGQLIGFAKSSPDLHKIVLIAAQSGYWKLWKGKNRLLMWLNWYILFPVLTHIFGFLPSKKFSGMENLPKNVTQQWSNWGRKPNYLFDEFPEGELFFKKIKCSMLAISIENDFYAPKEAVDWLVHKFENASIKRLHLKSSDYHSKNIGHFGVFREKFSDTLWSFFLEFIKN